MREIKYRAWDRLAKVINEPFSLDNSGWVEFDFGNGVDLMQFTGLKDKNGVDIYEGDIVKHFFNGKFRTEEVEFTYGSFRYKSSGLHVGYSTDGIMAASGNHTEVIGNIYQNLKLLKGKK